MISKKINSKIKKSRNRKTKIQFSFFSNIFRKKTPKSKLIKPNKSLKIVKRPNLQLITVVFVLILIGIVMIFSASALIAYRYNDGDTLFFVKRQIVWVIVGLFISYVIYNLNPKYYPQVGKVLFIIAIILLLWLIPEALSPTLVDGTKAIEWPLVKTLNGATRWIDLVIFDIQPAEFIKIPLIIIISRWLTKGDREFKAFIESIKKFKDDNILYYTFRYLTYRYFPLLMLGFVSFLIFLQKELDSIAIIAISVFAILWLSEKDRKTTFFLMIGSLIGGIGAILATPFRNARFTAFLQIFLQGAPDETVRRAEGFQIWQVLTAIGSGGLLGVGFNESKIKLFFLQEAAYTDSIFAIIGEEFGLIGVIFIILLFLILAKTGFTIASEIQDSFQKYLVVGVTSLITGQAFLNIAANLSLIPFGGMPLPFISYGGSTTIMLMVGVAMVLGISKKEVKISTD